MSTTLIRLANIQEIRQYVTETLSRFESLDPSQVALEQRVLRRGGRACGLFYSLNGPRMLRLTAIWEADGNTILFYGSDGRRLNRVRLAEAPALDSCLNRAA